MTTKQLEVVIGTPINSRTAYILKNFLKNQTEIQKKFREKNDNNIVTVFATEDKFFSLKLENILWKYSHNLNADVVFFKTDTPNNCVDKRIWNIVSARNAIREYFLESDADYLIFMDADMIFDPEIVNKLIKIAEKGYDVVYNGYLDRGNPNGINLTGFGGTLIKRWIMEKVRFRCKERNGRVIDEGVFFEFDLVKLGAKVFRGFISYSEHHDPKRPPSVCYPRELKLSERIRNNPHFRFLFHLISIPLCYDILWHLSMKLKT